MDPLAVWADPADEAWIALSSRTQPMAARLAGRTDVIVRIHPSPEPVEETSLWDYRRPRGEIVLNAHAVLRPLVDDPWAIDPSSAQDRAKHPVLCGAVCAAAAYARHTLWTMPAGYSPGLSAVTLQLESARALAAFLVDRSAYRTWLRAACQLLIRSAGSFRTPEYARAIGVLGLRRAGVLSETEAAPVHALLGRILGEDGLTTLETLIEDALALPDGDLDALLVVAARALLLFEASGGAPPGKDGAAEQDPLGDTIARTMADVGQSAASLAHDAVQAPVPSTPARAAQSDRRAVAASAFRHTFHGADAMPESALRDPGPVLLSQARALASDLRAARHRSPTLTTVSSRIPPGRLRMSEAMRREAQHAAQVEISARPWLQRRRRQDDPPVLRLGLSWDTSQSQAARQRSSADMAWALAWAIAHVDGKMAGVAWNSNARPVVWPGRIPTHVIEPVCRGKSSGCPQSLRALDGALRLTSSSGPRVVVVLTDGKQPNHRHIDAEVDLLATSGVSVLWVTDDIDSWTPRRAQHVRLSLGEENARALGQAICGIFSRDEESR